MVENSANQFKVSDMKEFAFHDNQFYSVFWTKDATTLRYMIRLAHEFYVERKYPIFAQHAKDMNDIAKRSGFKSDDLPKVKKMVSMVSLPSKTKSAPETWTPETQQPLDKEVWRRDKQHAVQVDEWLKSDDFMVEDNLAITSPSLLVVLCDQLHSSIVSAPADEKGFSRIECLHCHELKIRVDFATTALLHLIAPEPISTVHPKFQEHFDNLKAVITEDPSSCTVLNYNHLVKLAGTVKQAMPSRSLKANLDKVDEAQQQ